MEPHTQTLSAEMLDDRNIGVTRFLGNHPVVALITQAAGLIRQDAPDGDRIALIRRLVDDYGAGDIGDGNYPPNDPVFTAASTAYFALEGQVGMEITLAGETAFAANICIPPGETLKEEHRGRRRPELTFPFSEGTSASADLREQILHRLEQLLDAPISSISRDADNRSELIEAKLGALLHIIDG